MPHDKRPVADPMDAYEDQVDAVIRICGGDTRSALKALILANECLEMEIKTLHAEMTHRSTSRRSSASTRRLQ